MTTLNTLIQLATDLGNLALDTSHKGIAIGLQQARFIVLGQAVHHADSPVEAHELMHATVQATMDTVEAQLAYMAEQEQPVDNTEEDTVEVTLNSEKKELTIDDVMEAFRKHDEEDKPLFESTKEDDFDKALDEFITALESDDNPFDAPKVVVIDTTTPEGRRELEKMFSEE